MKLAEQITQLEQEYNNYMDSSDVILQYYKNQQTSGLDKHFLKIDEWLEADTNENRPLVIEADDGVGKKTLLVKWIQYHEAIQKGRLGDIIIPHFTMVGGNNSNYFYAIYRILIKLRELLNIGQKVELLEDKLRRYFAYWMDVCNTELENQIIKDCPILYNRIILIFEGINHFIDPETDLEANVAFWLPQLFPKRIKVIVTASPSSAAMAYFHKVNFTIIHISNELSIVQKMIEGHHHRKAFLSDITKEKLFTILQQYPKDLLNNSIFVKTYVSLLVPYPSQNILTETDIKGDEIEKIINQIDLHALAKVKSLDDLFEFILDQYCGLVLEQKKFVRMLLCFTITQKGLTINEVQIINDISSEEWKIFLAFFKVFLMHYKQYWIINNDLFKGVLIRKYLNTPEIRNQLHEEIADALHQTSNSIRKLEEQTFHLFSAKAYFKLKEIISTIENFLLLFNPNNKYDLCRYWQTLEQQGFDPVIEYNKAIEGFEMQYHPSSEDLFRIIVQVSRFLKEFGDFETYFTPNFRHPPIQGIEDEFEDIGLLQELERMNVCFLIDPVKKKKDEQISKQETTPQMRIAQKIQKLQNQRKSQRQGFQSKTSVDLKKQVIAKPQSQPQSIADRNSKSLRPVILSKIEALNVDIPYNRLEVRSYFQKLVNYDQSTQESPTAEQEQDPSLIPNNYVVVHHLLPKPKPLSKPRIHQEVEQGDHQPTDYYYKRWLWIQFPWACLSLQSDYSGIMKQCAAKATEYMSVSEEQAFTKQALKIAIEAKLKKKMMYLKSDEMQDTQPDNNRTIMSLVRHPTQPRLHSNQGLVNSQETEAGQNQQTQISRITGPLTTRHVHAHTTEPFFLTEEYLDMNHLQKEIDVNKQQLRKLPDIEMNTTLKIIDKSRQIKDKTKPFQFQQINVSASNQSILPRLRGSIQSHNLKEVQIMEQQAKEMQKEFDNLIYQNNALARKLGQLKTIQLTEGKNNDQGVISSTEQKIERLKSNYMKAEFEYLLSIVQKDRLKIIIKICADNKSYNEEWIRDLNYLLRNLNKLIISEKQEISEINGRIKLVHETHIEYVNAFNTNLTFNKKIHSSINKTMKDKEELDQFFQQSDSIIEQQSTLKMKSLQQQFKKQEEIKQQGIKRAQLEKSSKTMVDKIDNLREQFQFVQQYIDLKSDYQSTPQFINLLDNLEKRTEIQSKILEQEDKIRDIKILYHLEYNHLETLKNATISNDPQKSKRDSLLIKGKINKSMNIQVINEKIEEFQRTNTDKAQQLLNIQNLNQNFINCLNNLNNKLKTIPILDEGELNLQTVNFNLIQVGSNLIEKQQLVQTLFGEKFKLVLENKFDFNGLYKEAYKYQQDPLLNEIEIS